ncbi:putative ABC multidrug transporter [Xylaria sp. FL0064]|nr:putative ABC multidrug transporter [Xylaria sp. FL0064]
MPEGNSTPFPNMNLLNEHQKQILDRQLNGLPPNEHSDKQSILKHTTPREKIILAISFIGAILGGVLNPLIGVIYGQLVGVFDNYKRSSSPAIETRKRLDTFSLYYVYVSIAIFVLLYVSTVGFYYVGERIARTLRKNYLMAILRQNMAFFDAHEPGEISMRIMSDMGTIQEGITSKISIASTAVATLFAAFIISLVEHWKIALVLSPTFVLMAISGALTATRATKAQAKAKPAGDKAFNISQETLSSMRHVFAFGLQEHLAAKFDSCLRRAGYLHMKSQNIISLFTSWTNSVPILVFALCFWVGSIFLVRGEVSAGQITTIALVVNMGAFAILRIAPSAQALISTMSSAAVVIEQMKRRSTQDPFDSSGVTLNDLKGDIEFRGVSLAYPQRQDHLVMNNISFTCPAMKTTAIVGASGSGKSSVVSLLQRFYEPIGGEICVDGVDIQLLNLRWLRDQMALVEQQPTLFDTAIFENISYGAINLPNRIPEDEMAHKVFLAAKTANVHDFISALPCGYQTRVGENGIQLSGGERQKIAIARALIRNPTILLLDEATSALDSRSESTVQNALVAAADNRTTIVIAHRLSTIRNADNIIVFSQGRVIEQGTHSELIALNNHYSRLVRAQQVDSFWNGEGAIIEDNHYSFDIGSPLIHSKSSVMGHRTGPSLTVATTNQLDEKHKSKSLGLGKTLVFLARLNKEEWTMLYFALFCSLIVGLVIPGQAVVFARILQVFSLSTSEYGYIRSQANVLAGIFLILAFVAFVFSLGAGYSFSYAAEKLARRIKYTCFRSIISQNVEFFDNKAHSTGALLSVLSSSVDALNGLSGPVIGGSLTFLATILGGIVVSLVIGWKLALVCTATIPIVVACGWARLQMLAIFDSKTRQSSIDSASYAGELIKSVSTVASLGLEEFVLERYDEFLSRQSEKSLRSILGASSFYAASQSVVYLAVALAFWYGGMLIIDEEYSIFQYFVCHATLVSGSQLAGTIFTFAPDASKAMHACGEVKALLDSRVIPPTSKTHAEEEKREHEAKGHIEFKSVSFAYPSRVSRFALDNFSLDVGANQYIALVGPSGCGKSTILSLVERFYDPTNGTILVGGQDLSKIDIVQHRKAISLVSQDPVMYSGTIKENVAMGLAGENVSDEAIWAACRMANIDKFIISLQDGLSTTVGPGGCMLSGGQKQRIAIARALIRNPRILLLDEATSALDTESESLVQEALEAASRGRTTIAVAHRLSTIMRADRICVLEHGRLVEVGTHDQLVQKRGMYWELLKMQNL